MDLQHAPTPARNRQGPLSDRQRALYLAIVEHKRSHDGNSPSIRYLQAKCAISSSAVVSFNLRRLVAAHLIELEGGGRSRSIRVCGGRWELDS